MSVAQEKAQKKERSDLVNPGQELKETYHILRFEKSIYLCEAIGIRSKVRMDKGIE